MGGQSGAEDPEEKSALAAAPPPPSPAIPAPSSSSTKEALVLPDGFGSTLIGPGGETVNRMQEQTGARIFVEKERDRARVVGKPDQVAAALHLIQELLAQTGGKKAPCRWFAKG